MTSESDRSRSPHGPATPLDDEGVDLALPFYAIGKLPPAERDAMAARIANDPGARRRLDIVEEERGAVVSLNEAVPAPSLAAMERLFERMDAEAPREAAPQRKAAPAPSGFAGFWARLTAPRTLGYAAAALALIAVIQSGLLVQLLSRSDPQATYVTASAPQTPAAAQAMVRFAPGVAMADVEAWLSANHVRIVEGPLPGGVWRLEAREGDPAALINRLRGAQNLFAVVLPQ